MAIAERPALPTPKRPLSVTSFKELVGRRIQCFLRVEDTLAWVEGILTISADKAGGYRLCHPAFPGGILVVNPDDAGNNLAFLGFTAQYAGQ